jgi:hypothetical protein
VRYGIREVQAESEWWKASGGRKLGLPGQVARKKWMGSEEGIGIKISI